MPADMPDELPDDTPLTRQEAGEVPVLTELKTTTPRKEEALRALADVPHEPGSPKPDTILIADNVVRRFGGLTAVDVGHVEIQRGSITALIGPNGAGKTTFFNLLTGFDRPDSGSWTFNGKSLSGMPAYKVARGGMVRTFQLTKALAKLTVIENMRLGAVGQRGESLWRAMFPGFWRSQENDITGRAHELLGRFKLDTKRDDFAGSLSGGQRKLLEMARALMVQPEMVMLDEPMAGVNPALTQSLLGHVKDLREQGMTVLFVEHDMDMVRDISDWVLVMAYGKLISEGPPDTVMADTRVIDAYLGAHHDQSLLEGDVEAQIQQEVAAELAAAHGEAVPVQEEER
jgi:neutral amino acid transport system ATP-binding protein